MAMFHQLRELKVGLSVDDFGVGYSSFRYVDRYPLTEIKIDKGLIGEMRAERREAYHRRRRYRDGPGIRSRYRCRRNRNGSSKGRPYGHELPFWPRLPFRRARRT